ncbi:Lipoprotein OS=Streptomyces fumanus OX=67302 GN=GCM10018772_39580 PE=4 SV=1 [Streptomyces fumanus]
MQVRRSARSARPVSALAGLLLAAALALTGCSAADDSGADGADKAAGARADSQADSGAGSGAGYEEGKGGAADDGKASAPPKLTPDHVIHTASLTVEVENVPKALARARAATESAGGYVGEESTARDEEGAEYTEVVLRVPVDAYDKVLAGLEGTGRLVERNAEARDVTDQVVDVDSRVKTQRASVARIRELMDRATKLSDVVTLEGELSSRQAELESLLARQASLKDRTDLATITLSLSERPAGRDDGSDDPGSPTP